MSKAWYAYNEYEGTVIAVFADTRSKARKYIWDNNDEYDLGFDRYIEINPTRFERIDYLDKPDGYVMDWNKAEDRLVLVKETGWYCSDPTLYDCKMCTASNYCDLYAEGLVTK